MYAIHHRRFYNSKTDFVEIATNIPTLEKARERRVVSGDLVVYQHSHEVVGDPEWLWNWELRDKKCYAQRAMKTGKRQMRQLELS